MYFRIACPGPWVLLINTFRHTVFAATFRINEIKLFCDVRRTNEDTLIHSQHFVLNGALHQVCALPESILGVHCLAPPPTHRTQFFRSCIRFRQKSSASEVPPNGKSWIRHKGGNCNTGCV